MNIPFDFSSFDSRDNPEEKIKKMLAEFLESQGIEDLRDINDMELAEIASKIQDNPQVMQAMMAQMSSIFSDLTPENNGEIVNWDLALTTAKQLFSTRSPEPKVTTQQRKSVDQAMRLADLWLDDVTEFEPSGILGKAWSRTEWVENTMVTWKKLTKPVATSIAFALTDALGTVFNPEQLQHLPEELLSALGEQKNFLNQTASVLNNIGGSLFAIQLGEAIGQLAAFVVSTSDIGIPLVTHQAAFLPNNIEELGKGLGVDTEEITLFLAVREAAHQRLYTHVPWLAHHIIGAIQAYARGIKVDVANINEPNFGFDISDPESLQDALSAGVFIIESTPEQKSALARLETVLALIEGWVDEVTNAATGHMLSANALMESIRRRRATGGPAEKAFSSLVGLELRPSRMREAAQLWHNVLEQEGQVARDAIWSHPDLLPTTEDLDDPLGFVKRRQELVTTNAGVDAALEAILNGASFGKSIKESELHSHTQRKESNDGSLGSDGDENTPDEYNNDDNDH